MILLDDAQSTEAEPSSRLYEHALQHWTIYRSSSPSETNAAVDQCLQEINEALAKGLYVVAAFAYELGQYIHKLEMQKNLAATHRHPLIQAWSFKSYESFSKKQVDDFIQNGIQRLEPASQIAGVANLHFSVDEQQFTSDIKTLQEFICTRLAGKVSTVMCTDTVHHNT